MLALLWVLSAGVLFFGFGFLPGSAVLRTLGSLAATVSGYLPPILLLAALGACIVWKMASIFGDDDDSPT